MTIRFNEPFVTGREIDYLQQVISSKQFAGNGPFTKRTQKWFEGRYGVPHALLTHSCTGGLELAAMLLDLGPGDEVILPSYTFVSTATAFLRTGAKLVFCEVDPATMTIDVADVERRITPNTKVIVPVHYAGVGADMTAVMALAAKRGLHVVEDAAQGLDAKRDGKWLGGIAPLAAVSFHETKNVHCGLGGVLFVNDASLFDRAEDMWERGTDRSKMFKGLVDKYSWVEPGSSFYPSELQAAFLMAQLEAIEGNTRRRAEIWCQYETGLQDLGSDGTLRLCHIPEGCVSNFHAYWFHTASGAEADRLREHLSARGVQVTIHYVPLHGSKMGRKMGYRAEDLPVTVDAAERLLRLPLHDNLTDADVATVIREVRGFFGRT
jgi:dTDP-4-amino-4,6-dideoxygalactose transaminase